MKKHFTIGLAGHIDHGKTSLTKALTNVDTDRLKEEKERAITIELGYAPLIQNELLQISIIDVPGHERFIKRMIAGVSGIDFALLIVAADEGVMPQTKEHLAILDFLGIKGGMVVLTKADMVEEDLLLLAKEEIEEELQNTIFKDCPMYIVDSLSGLGIDKLKEAIIDSVNLIPPRDMKGSFRLPIDSVFTVKGQGTVVRGTVNEGSIEEGQTVYILPDGKETKARQIQVHHQQMDQAYAGQRAAINLSNMTLSDVKRGDVLVAKDSFSVTDVIDVSIRMVKDLEYIVKQRMPIVCYIGTAEVHGRVVFFDRNEIKEEAKEVLCQLRLEEKIVTKRGDVLIVRRPTPSETIGGGWVIDPIGKKYRFGMQTMEQLHRKKDGTKQERLEHLLKQKVTVTLDEAQPFLNIDSDELQKLLETSAEIVEFSPNLYTHSRTIEDVKEDLYDCLLNYEKSYSLRKGMPKAELFQKSSMNYSKVLLEYCLKDGLNDMWKVDGHYVCTYHYKRQFPKQWKARMENVLQSLDSDGLKVQSMDMYLKQQGIPEELSKDFLQYLITEQIITPLDDLHYIYLEHYQNAIKLLKLHTNDQFTVGEAKDVLGLSRKYMIPLLEKLDNDGYTNRVENNRLWDRSRI